MSARLKQKKNEVMPTTQRETDGEGEAEDALTRYEMPIAKPAPLSRRRHRRRVWMDEGFKARRCSGNWQPYAGNARCRDGEGDRSNGRERGQVKGRLVILSAVSGPHFSLYRATWWVPGSATWCVAAVKNRKQFVGSGDVACGRVFLFF